MSLVQAIALTEQYVISMMVLVVKVAMKIGQENIVIFRVHPDAVNAIS